MCLSKSPSHLYHSQQDVGTRCRTEREEEEKRWIGKQVEKEKKVIKKEHESKRWKKEKS